MAVVLVRHAKAGDRDRWTGDDSDRPLTDKGHVQAEGLVTVIASVPTALVSSPYLRCIQTLEPLARTHALDVAVDDRLAEGAPLESALSLLDEVADGAVLCTHGDVIPMLVDALIRRGMVLQSSVPGVKKGSWFALVRESGQWTHATWHPAPN